MPNVHVITILGIDPNDSLQLSDSGATIANPGDIIQWSIGANSGVANIVAIKDVSTADVFNPDPSKLGNSQIWQGTIDPDLSGQFSQRLIAHS